MDPNSARSSRPRTLDSVGGSMSRPVGRAAGSAHVIDLREKAGSFESPSSRPAPKKPLAPKKKILQRKSTSSAAVPAPVVAPAPATASVPSTSAAPPVVKPVAARASRQAPAPSNYSDAAFPDQPRFWPAFWRFLFLLILLGLIIALGVYIYFSYYQQG
jgi:hypothetical protein